MPTITEVFERAGAPPSVVAKAREIEKKWKDGKITAEEAYIALIGLAIDEVIPLYPRDVGDIREALGLPRSKYPISL